MGSHRDALSASTHKIEGHGVRHPQRVLDLRHLVGDVDLQLFNRCADAIVNSTLVHLSWLQLPSTAVTLESLLATALGVKQVAEAALLEWDVERLYRAIDDRRSDGKDGQRDGAPAHIGGCRGNWASARRSRCRGWW
ncbi:MAG: hypothetical protein Q7T97_07185 [Burkholderiaceae bacterium]|nr:hypothetical protein [Burkholderiaceae bacterium]